MNDRFKFRVWSKKYNKFIEDNRYPIGSDYQLIITQNGTLIKLGLGDFEDDCEDSYSWATFNDYEQDCIVMQSTGLKDKNGKLIYEGDVLGGTYGNLYVHYCDKCKQFQLKAKDYGCMACEGDIHWYELVESENENELEVIGNIYQDKDLLNENS